jgi:methyltransferase (TIGR00027 family)
VRDDRPSLTAAVVSFARGALSRSPHSPCYDPVARALLPPPWRQLLAMIDLAGPGRGLAEWMVRVAMGGLAGHVELRTALIDHAVREAVDAGVSQLVVLGAGLDARAFRLDGLGAVDVFEVDHPATQAWKRRRAQALAHRARALSFVPVDFSRTSLNEGLGASAHDPVRPSVWVWEGVTMYLPPGATSAALRDIAARSASGSRLVLTYLRPEVTAKGRAGSLSHPLFRAISEPLLGLYPSEQLRALLAAHGFEVLSDEWPAQAAPRFGRRVRLGPFTPSERVVVALRMR